MFFSGMSTIHEVLTARQCGMEVFSFSVITNSCIFTQDALEEEYPNVEEVVDNAATAEEPPWDILPELVLDMAKFANI